MDTRKSRLAADSAALAAGTILAGLLAYAFFILASRSLGAERAAPVAALWTYWSAGVAVLTFPLQHWVIKALASGGEAEVAATLPRVLAVVAGLALLAGATSWWGRWSLFGRGDLLFPCFVAMITVGSCVLGVLRGGLAGRDRFVATAAVFAGENVVRVAGAVVATVLGLSEGWFGLAMALGPLVALSTPSAFRFARSSASSRPAVAPLTFLSGFAGASLVAQIVLTGGPVALAAVGGAPREVTALFATLAVFRAPYLLALGLVTQLTGFLTRAVVEGRTGRLATVGVVTLLGTVVGAVVGGVVGGAVGPSLLKAIFGSDVVLPSGVVARVAVGTAFGLGNLVLTLLLIARGASGTVMLAWLGALVAAVSAALWAGGPLDHVALGFVVAEGVAFVLMFLFERRLLGGSPDVEKELEDVALRDVL